MRAFGSPTSSASAASSRPLHIRTLREGAIDFAGKHYTLRDCELVPAGRAHMRLSIGSRGEPDPAPDPAHVDAWNGWRAGAPSPSRAALDVLRCRPRPEGVERTMAVLVRYPDATEPPDPRATPLTGTPEEIAAFLRDLAGAGIAHVQVVLEPNTCETIERFAPVLELLDAG